MLINTFLVLPSNNEGPFQALAWKKKPTRPAKFISPLFLVEKIVCFSFSNKDKAFGTHKMVIL